MKKTGSYIYTDAWLLAMSDGIRHAYGKDYYYRYVRPVLAL